MATKKPVAKAKAIVEKIICAGRCIEAAMKRHDLSLFHVRCAVAEMIRAELVDAVLRLRAEGLSIHKIARRVHLDDRRVSKIIKEGPGYCKPGCACGTGCGKPCGKKAK